MDVRLARIDDRLIHGQVATAWSKATNVDRIIVVSDSVAKDTLRKFLLKQAAPPGIKSSIVTVKKIIEVFHSEMLADTKVMLLFTNPQDVERLVRQGISIDSVNIGGMSFSEGKTMITKFISVNQADFASFRYLDQQGVELEIRKVPADRKINLMSILEKAQSFH
ncbi:MAG: mannose/fructose/sorbose PTS transporter subunit IIB [Enterococcus sp.]